MSEATLKKCNCPWIPIETTNKPEELPNQLSFELLSLSLLKQLCDPNDNL